MGDFTARFDTAVWGQSPRVVSGFCGAGKAESTSAVKM